MLDSILLRIAKSSIIRRLDDSYSFDEEKLLKEYPYLNKDGASFVTFKNNNELRGCIGSVTAYRTLLEDIMGNAVAAGFKDPRFEHLHVDEFSSLSLEVSVLTEPEILEYENFDDLCQKLQPNVDGLILKHDIYQGTFLPQVWKQLKTPKSFLEHLSMKAGAYPSIYEEHPTLYRYRVDALEADFDEVLQL